MDSLIKFIVDHTKSVYVPTQRCLKSPNLTLSFVFLRILGFSSSLCFFYSLNECLKQLPHTIALMPLAQIYRLSLNIGIADHAMIMNSKAICNEHTQAYTHKHTHTQENNTHRDCIHCVGCCYFIHFKLQSSTTVTSYC